MFICKIAHRRSALLLLYLQVKVPWFTCWTRCMIILFRLLRTISIT